MSFKDLTNVEKMKIHYTLKIAAAARYHAEGITDWCTWQFEDAVLAVQMVLPGVFQFGLDFEQFQPPITADETAFVNTICRYSPV